MNMAVDTTQSGISLVCPWDLLPMALSWAWAEPTVGGRGLNQHPRLVVWPEPRAAKGVGWRRGPQIRAGKGTGPSVAVCPGWV